LILREAILQHDGRRKGKKDDKTKEVGRSSTRVALHGHFQRESEAAESL
jgi:hypothetical protein